jgi:hypothetical protein
LRDFQTIVVEEGFQVGKEGGKLMGFSLRLYPLRAEAYGYPAADAQRAAVSSRKR